MSCVYFIILIVLSMTLESRIFYRDSSDMTGIDDLSVDLIVTSPPYPMIDMWDDVFCQCNGDISSAINASNGITAFELMHEVLDRVWKECVRVLCYGGFICINIGDATRTIGEDFSLYSNHSRITENLIKRGLSPMPMIHWFKPTNAPNKFMGSGMLPAGAYVTLEHEYILIFRKGGKRTYNEGEKAVRRKSAFFWEERNKWFSDTWNLKGERQLLSDNTAGRMRSAAFPIELPHRLINMYSIQGDLVLDPFMGTGTTLSASIMNGRGCIGFETDSGFKDDIKRRAEDAIEISNEITQARLNDHLAFIEERRLKNKEIKHENGNYNFPVVTSQEREISLPELVSIDFEGNKDWDRYIAEYRGEA